LTSCANKSLQLTNNTPLRFVLWSTEFKRYRRCSTTLRNAYNGELRRNILLKRLSPFCSASLSQPDNNRSRRRICLIIALYRVHYQAYSLLNSPLGEYRIQNEYKDNHLSCYIFYCISNNKHIYANYLICQ